MGNVLLSQVYLNSWIGSEQHGTELVPIWDADIAGSDLMCYTTCKLCTLQFVNVILFLSTIEVAAAAITDHQVYLVELW